MKFLPFAALALILTGCPVVSPDPPMDVNRAYEDLPAPPGFAMKENYGNTSPTAAFRVLTQTLRAPEARAEHAAKFYKDSFPLHGWTLEKGDGAAPGPFTLAFTRKDERCRLEIREEGKAVVVSLKVNRKD